MDCSSVKFDLLRAAFLKYYKDHIFEGLETVMSKPVELSPTPLSQAVKQRFMTTVKELGAAKLSPVVHGTDHCNFDSIFEQGLLIPGQGNPLQVANGAKYGVGIYTADMNAAWLSRQFCSAPEMLLCAVLKSSEVKRVRNSRVVFDAAHVVPLFLATSQAFNDHLTPRLSRLELPRSAPVTKLLKLGSLLKGRTISDLKEAGHPMFFLRLIGYTVAALQEAGVTSADVLRAGYAAAALHDAGYTASRLKKAGYSAVALKEAGYCDANVLSLNYPAVALQEAGYAPAVLKAVGFADFEVLHAGYPAACLKQVGYTLPNLRDACYTPADLKDAYTPVALKEAGYSDDQVLTAGYPAAVLKELKYTVAQLRAAGYTAVDLKECGYTSADLKELRTAGYTAVDLKEADYAAVDLKEAGYEVAELFRADYSDRALKEAGYTARALKKGHFRFFPLRQTRLNRARLPGHAPDIRQAQAETFAMGSVLLSRDSGLLLHAENNFQLPWKLLKRRSSTIVWTRVLLQCCAGRIANRVEQTMTWILMILAEMVFYATFTVARAVRGVFGNNTVSEQSRQLILREGFFYESRWFKTRWA